MSQSDEIQTDLYTQIGHFGTAEFPEDLDFQPESQIVSPVQRQFVLAIVRGFSISTAARKLNVNHLAAQRWANSAWFRSIFEEERAKVIDESADFRKELLAPLLAKSLDAISDLLSSEDEKVRLGTVDLVFNQFFQNKRPVGRPSLNQNQNNSAPEDLSDIMSRAQQKVQELKDSVHGNIIQLRANGTEG